MVQCSWTCRYRRCLVAVFYTLLPFVRPQCEVIVSYDVSLGQGTGVATGSLPYTYTDVPIFFGQATVHTWALGWNFTAGESLTADNVFTPNITAIRLTGNEVQLESTSPNNSITPYVWTAVSFLGTKQQGPVAGNSYKVGPIRDVVFNNLRCQQSGSPSVASPPSTAQQVASLPAGPLSQPDPLLIEYAPVVYLAPALTTSWALDPDSFSTFLVRISNMGATYPILPVSRVTLQYYFNGVQGQPDTTDPLSQYDMDCLDATIGCGALLYNITPALPGVFGARYVLNVGFKEGSALLRNVSTTSNTTRTTTASGNVTLGVLEVLLRIQSRQFLRSLNASNDYSYFDSPRSGAPITNSTNVVPRIAVPNVRIPGYLDGRLDWGAAPIAKAEDVAPQPVSQPGASAPSAPADSVQCNYNSQFSNSKDASNLSASVARVCGLSVTYCCSSVDGGGVTQTIPPVWPPRFGGNSSPSVAGVPGPCRDSGCQPVTAPAPALLAAAGIAGAGGSGGLSPAAIAGLAGGLAALLLAVVLGVGLLRRRLLKVGVPAWLPWQQMAKPPHPARPLKKGGDAIRWRLWRLGGLRRWTNAGSASPASSATGLTRAGLAQLQPDWSQSSQHRMWVPHQHVTFQYEGAPPAVGLGKPFFEQTEIGSAAVPVGTARQGGSLPDTGQGRHPLLDLRAKTMPLSVLLQDRATDCVWDWPTASSRGSQGGHQLAATWHGVLRQVGEKGTSPRPARRRGLRRALSWLASRGTLPPLRALPPLLTVSSVPPQPVHMNIDFDLDIRPFLGRCLGRGGFGSVYEGSWRGRPVAVKGSISFHLLGPVTFVLSPVERNHVRTAPEAPADVVRGGQMVTNTGVEDPEAFNALVRETELASMFDSDRLVKVFGACLKPSSACIVMELLKENLHQRIYDRSRPRMTGLEVLQVAHDVAEGLAYLHPSVIHRDLKPSNILLDECGRAKLADFGISRIKDPSKTYLTTANDNGTPMYMAPEQFNGGHVDEKVDVYSWACIVNECITRRPPWGDLNFFQIILAVAIRGQRPAMDYVSTPEALRRLLSRCWAADPRFRPSTAEILRLTELWIQQTARGCIQWSV